MVKHLKRRKPAPRSRDQDTEQRILEAARTVFLRRGTAGARMQEIAREAGVNQALLHYYFRSKERLSAAVFQQVASRIFPALVQTLAADISLDQKIDTLIGVYLDNLSQNPFLPGYLISELHHHPERVQQLLSIAIGAEPQTVMAPLLEKLGEQIDERVAPARCAASHPQQFAINIVSLCIFPFAARPMLSSPSAWTTPPSRGSSSQRRKELPDFIRNALRP